MYQLSPKDIKKDIFFWALWFLFLTIFFSTVISLFELAASSDEIIDLSIIARIESSGNPESWNKADDSRGLYQITPVCLADYNAYHQQKFEPEELWNVNVNRIIAEWYLHERIPAMLRHFGKPVTVENILISYNAGISYVVNGSPIPKTTVNYLRKYNAGKN